MKTKKLIVCGLIFIAILIISFFTNSVFAESLGTLTITQERKVGDVTYKHQLYSNNPSSTKNIWKLVTCNPDRTITDTIDDLYCLRAGLGFTAASPSDLVVEYSQSYSMINDYQSIVNYFSSVTSDTTIFNNDTESTRRFYAVMWILDHMLLEGASDAQVTQYLKDYAGYTDSTLNASPLEENVLTRADIEAIQQLAIWYFTNADETLYHADTLPNIYMTINGDGLYDTSTYKTYADIFNAIESYGTQRQNRANSLYQKLITDALAAVSNGSSVVPYTPSREITVYLAGTNAANEQPVVRVEEKEPADVVLRKFISKVNGTALTGTALRAPTVDTSNLNKTVSGVFQTTAKYNHTKDPLKVSLGDTVTYTLRLYNEGDTDVYIKEVTDYLPAYLESATNSEWTVTNRKAVSKADCKVVGASSNLTSEIGSNLGDVLIPAAVYNSGTDNYTLSYVDVQITCTVKNTTPYDTNVTNIAQITKVTNSIGRILDQEGDDRDSIANGNFTLPTDTNLPTYTGGDNGGSNVYYDGTNKVNPNYYPGQEDDDDFEKVYVETPEIDLALRKYISGVNSTTLTGGDLRTPVADTSSLNKNGQTTAKYNHTKEPLKVSLGDTIKYKLRIYNEGKSDAYVKEVTDYLPLYLEAVTNSEWTISNRKAVSTAECKVVGASSNLTSEIGNNLGDVLIPAAVYNSGTDTYTLSYVEVGISCTVKNTTPYDTNVTNIAQITKMADENNIIRDRDRDSTADGNFVLPTDTNLPSYTGGDNGGSNVYYDGTNKVNPNYYPGQEDDDDFEKVYVETPEIDLALRKFITSVNGVDLTGTSLRAPEPDTSSLNKNGQTTAEYNHTKEPLKVSLGDTVTYTLRIYNEGKEDAYVKEVTDYLPAYLESATNSEWTVTNRKAVSTAECKVVGASSNLTSAIGTNLRNVLIPAAVYNSGTDNYTLSYVEVEISCTVSNTTPYDTNVTNIAQITKMADENNIVRDRDRDSTANGNFVLPTDANLPLYTGGDNGGSNVYYDGTNKVNPNYYPGQEDDDDFEKVYVETPEIDLALRKYISAINGTELTNRRAPEPDTSNLNKNGQTTAVYNHTKEPLKVSFGDIVTYTLRIYNEGKSDAYVKEVTDYLPEYLEYIPYGNDTGSWWLLDSATGRIATATEYCVVTNVGGNIAQSEIGKALGDVLLPAAAYNAGTDSYTLSYVDIEISCRVMLTTPYNTNVTNIAQITKMADENEIIRDNDRDSEADGNFALPTDENLPSYTGGDNGGSNLYYDGTNKVNPNYYPGQEDDDDFEKVYVETPVLDLALRKFISKVGDTPYDRAPVVDTTPLRQGEDTAIYNHSKTPVEVEVGDVVTYTIRLYNEGDVDARVSEVTDYLATYLRYVPFGDDTNGDWWTSAAGEGYNVLTSTENCVVVNVGGNTDTNAVGEKIADVTIPAYNSTTDVLSYIDVEVHCQVLPVEKTTKVTNIAEITDMTDEYGNPLEEDRDSEPDDVDLPDDFPGYKDEEIEEGKPYIPGQEDDDDFEKVIVVVPEIDLSLRKFILAVDDEILTGNDLRAPVVNTTPLDNHTGTTAIYNHTKTPITVKKGGLVTYTIRVYNEGEVDMYVNEITDYLPNYLTYIEDNETNLKYGWSYDNNTRKVTTTITAEENEAGNAVYANRQNGKLLLKYAGNQELNYIDVEIVCKVNDNAPGNRVLTNLAQITEMEDTDGNIVDEDRDSTPDGNFDLPDENEKPTYKDDESNNPYVPGQEDDDDFEKVIVKPDFDLALRKFITKVGVTNINNRYPEVTYVDGKLVYTHTKEPVELVTGDVVTYTIRIFNEGEADGYANEITDDVPEGLEFLPENETNVEYRWKMLDENQEETSDVSEAKYIITDYLSEDQEAETGRTNIIKAFDKEAEITGTNPDFKDVKIAFKVTYKATTKEESARIITNTAQISADSDDDIDSKPNRDEVYNHDEENEDDIDFDRVKVKYFDLSLLKWVAQTQITLDGKTTKADTGHTAETSHNEAPVKIEIKASDIKKISIKYIYTIRITNEGEIEGYATEITDYIPEGLKFVQEDNPNWYEISDGVVGTRALEDTLLKPGETADVEIVLTWINSTENFGEKVNVAEISEDKNESDSPDVDSTPNNKVPDEDDIDDAPVVLAVKTGSAQIYVGLTLIILVTFAGGTGLIKKYVLE